VLTSDGFYSLVVGAILAVLLAIIVVLMLKVVGLL
jgi:tetrahydromethanopterin S-methyltransferase subunit F